MKYLLLVCLALIPSVSQAALLINEIAWMGTTESANDEWIELFNNGDSSVSVDGWVLSDGQNLNINLVGTIPAQSFAVLERTDDSSAPGTAFLIYTGALTNTGATLTLRDAGGAIVEQVVGGENWEEVGGDNVTKETAQRTSTGWLTAVATPGESNASESSSSEETASDNATASDEESSGQSVTVSKTKNESTIMVLPDVTLNLKLIAPIRAYVNQTVSMEVVATGAKSGIIDSLGYQWNFGDANVAVGSKSVNHIYQYPGTYVVYVEAEYATQKAKIRQTVTVLPVDFVITRNRQGDIQINNNAKYEVDISGYRVLSDDSYVLPQNTILLPNASVTIPKKRVGARTRGVIGLADAEGEMVAFYGAVPTTVAAANNFVAATPSIGQTAATPPSVSAFNQPSANFSFGTEVAEIPTSIAAGNVESEVEEIKPIPQSAQLAEAVPDNKLPKNALPYLGLFGILALATLGVFAKGVK